MNEVEAKVRNCSIDIFRYVCAIMVVAIHTNPFLDINEGLGYVFSQIVPRIGVPFFFAVAGYFYIQKLEKSQQPFFPYIKRLLITYLIWSFFYYLVSFLRAEDINLKGFIISCIYDFFITGSYYHFWFFPALIISVCLTTFMFKIRVNKIIIPFSIILYILGCLGCSYYYLGIQIPFLGDFFDSSLFDLIRRIFLMGFPFFVSGYVVYKIQDKLLSIISNKSLLFIWGIVLVIWLAEIWLVLNLKLQVNIVLTLGLYLLVVATLLVLIKNPLTQYKSFSNMSRALANFTYYIHPFLNICLNFLASNILYISITETPRFLLTICLSFIGGLIIYKWNNKWLNYLIY